MMIRSIPNAIMEIKKIDPDTCFTVNALRNLVNNNEIPSFRQGRYIRVNVEQVIDYLEKCTSKK